MLGVLCGLVAIVVPAVASVGTAVFIGIILLAASIPLAVQALTAGDLGRTLLRLLVAGLTALAGLYLLVAPLEGTYTLTVMLVIWFVAIGFARLAGGLAHLGVPGAGATAFSGLLSSSSESSSPRSCRAPRTGRSACWSGSTSSSSG